MHRVKRVEYDEDELYDAEEVEYGEEGEEGDGTTAEDREQFATLTPVVRAELEEVGLQVSDKEIQDALWHYYWDVAKSVSYLKNARIPQTQKEQDGGKSEKKVKSKFDEAAERSAKKTAEQGSLKSTPNHLWFRDVPWTNVPAAMEGNILLAFCRPRPQLLGGSSKLAKLAEERKRKAALAAQPIQEKPNGALNSLDRLSKPRDAAQTVDESPKVEQKKYPIRKKRDPTPPRREPTPPTEDPREKLPDLRAQPTIFGRTISTGLPQDSLPITMSLQDVFRDGFPDSSFQGPSPDDVVLKAQQTKIGTTNKSAPVSGITKGTDALKLDSTPAPSTQTKVKSKGLDVPALWLSGRDTEHASIAFVVIGHVDHGKSTLMGRLLLDTGAVAQRDVDKYKKQATELGKSSFALAWVMDTGSEERERGATIDIAQHLFSTEKVDFTILDAPGHRDFVPNMIGGASMADLAVLVVDANQLESGIKGQTREHILLARACGLKKMIVAVNKLDVTNPPWDEQSFQNIVVEILKILTKNGFALENISFVPCSGLNGQNVVNATAVHPWVAKASPPLLQVLEESSSQKITEQLVRQPLRLQIADVYRGGITNPLSVSGRLNSGNVQVGDTVIIQPSGEGATVKGIEVGGDGKEWAAAGQMCSLHLTEIEPQHLRVGDVLCSTDKPVPVVENFFVRVHALEALLPQGVDVHLGRLHSPGSIVQLVALYNEKGELLKKRPRVVKEGQTASIKVKLESGAPLAVNDRIVLRVTGLTIAAGRIESVGT